MAAFIRTCGRELTLLSRTKTSHSLVVNKQCRTYARGFRRTPIRVLTADEEKREFIEKKVTFRDRIDDFDKHDPVLSNLTQSKDFNRLASIPRINKAAVEKSMSEGFNNIPRSGGFTSKTDAKNHPKQNSFTNKTKSQHEGRVKGKKETQTKLNKQTQQSYEKSFPKARDPVVERVQNFSGVKYTVLDSKDKKVGVLMRAARSKKLRENDRTILLEGSRLITDAFKAGGRPKSVYFKDFNALQQLPKEYLEQVPVYKCDERQMNSWSDMTSTSDIMALFHMPEDGETFIQPRTTIPLSIILDQIRDPGNMGTLLRTAAAVGCEKVIVMQECVDLWEPKVLRAGTGCHFRVPIYHNITWNYVENYIPVGARIYLTDKRRPTNKRIENYTDPEDHDNVADSLGKEENDYEDDPESDLVSNTSFENPDLVKQYRHAPLPVSYFSDLDYTRNNHTVLVISGKSPSVGLEAQKLTYDMYGQCIMIPMTNGVESLNAAVAGSVMMFEIYKQLHKQNISDQTGVPASEGGVEMES
ncbi:rRNA methyltransferase 3, mitochondrial-like [Ylistrum balloti]|uniref:rRNA methyltransferase 3, mitochondrial-like n=1 Tax=Ylistrum balloti TaxID=509963 RepID=UPI0029058187|nr:rRNA methyltransferase 3, mitochondrial-like [Ylistrum balloti]